MDVDLIDEYEPEQSLWASIECLTPPAERDEAWIIFNTPFTPPDRHFSFEGWLEILLLLQLKTCFRNCPC